jgi:hypothetical protein
MALHGVEDNEIASQFSEPVFWNYVTSIFFKLHIDTNFLYGLHLASLFFHKVFSGRAFLVLGLHTYSGSRDRISTDHELLSTTLQVTT